MLQTAAAHNYALAGGNALAAHGLLSRPTQDIDLFTPAAGRTGHVVDAVRAALSADGYAVHVVRTAPDGDFAERTSAGTARAPNWTWVATAPPRRPTPRRRPGAEPRRRCRSKTTALLGGALPRDFIDIATALDRYSRRELLELAFTRDRGLRPADAALAAQWLDRLDDDLFAPYQLTGDDVAEIRARFASWPRDAANDHEAQAAHAAAHRPPPTAAERAAAVFPTPITDALDRPASPPASSPAEPPAQHPPPNRHRR